MAALLVLFVAAGSLLEAQQTTRGSTQNPHGPIETPCQNCHTTTSWSPIRSAPEFNHNTETEFPLRGMHEGVACSRCHRQLVFSNVALNCADCHADVHRQQFGARCEDCHTVRGWESVRQSFQQHQNRFPLMGAHAAVECEACHRAAATGVFTGLSTECIGCHLNDYQTAQSIDHAAAGISTSCGQCHGMDQWQNARFDHARFTSFPLQGAHAQVECATCHVGGQFQGVTGDCFGCHAEQFNATTNPNHAEAGFPHACATCHTSLSWEGAAFDHSALTSFPLTGAHVSTECSSCHVAGRFASTPQQCAGCHTADFDQTSNPDHRTANFPMECETCHSTAAWAGAKFDHSRTRFTLTGAHASVECSQCHVGGQFSSVSSDCVSCHQSDFNQTSSPNHSAAGFPQDCTQCHTTQQWSGAQFDHGATGFALTGAHATVVCTQCHGGEQFSATSGECVGCHLSDFQRTENPNHVAGGFSQDCATCHSTAQWEGAQFDHGRTQFPLTGAHGSVECAQCHVGGQYANLATDCATCHLEDFQHATNPNHVAGGFSQDCTLCHSTAQWQGAQFDHGLTRFALTGAHAQVDCAQCHVGGQYSGTSSECASCHLEQFQQTAHPNHVSAGFPQDCTLCHSTAQWQGARFDHGLTRFALTGAHAQVDCQQCHVGGQYSGTSSECASCHLEQFQQTANPNHVSAAFPQDCTLCHSTARWQGAKFDHGLTRFALTGAHAQVDCAQCHVGGQYSGASTECASCHLEDFQRTTNPNHAAAKFTQDCTVCHTTQRWSGATFNHNAATGFPLTGTHSSVECAQCHVGDKFTGTPTACAACHLTDYNGTSNPNHAAAGFPQNCTLCHNTSAWAGAQFDHNTNTQFSLTGAHRNAQCAECHAGNQFAGTPSNCVSCHQTDFNNTRNPNHVAAGFPQDCSVCHSTSAWQGATFNHSTTGFALTGAHTSVACNTCHANGQFAGLSSACSSCHLDDYNGATSPNHAAAGFPQDCRLCHSTTQWNGAQFNHSTTSFPLTGSHQNVACANCHVNNAFSGTPTGCYSCHRNEYDTVTNPNHSAAGFPTSCQTCHNTTNWNGATFNHSFPIYAGKHRGKWNTCNECHTNSANYASFSCLNCHEHSQTRMDDKHKEISGYAYNSVNCLACHPNGDE